MVVSGFYDLCHVYPWRNDKDHDLDLRIFFNWVAKRLPDYHIYTYIICIYIYHIYIHANCCQHFSNKMLFEAQKRGWCLFVTLLSLPFERGDSCFPTQLLGISLHDYVDCRHFWSWILSSCLVFFSLAPNEAQLDGRGDSASLECWS